MLSSTFFHWQKRVNLSLRKKKKKWIYCMWWTNGETLSSSPPPTSTSICPVSPLNELLEDLPSQAVTDLHYVWLQEDRHINSSSGQVSLSNYVIKILCECMWIYPLCIVTMTELDLCGQLLLPTSKVFWSWSCLMLKLIHFTETPTQHSCLCILTNELQRRLYVPAEYKIWATLTAHKIYRKYWQVDVISLREN